MRMFFHLLHFIKTSLPSHHSPLSTIHSIQHTSLAQFYSIYFIAHDLKYFYMIKFSFSFYVSLSLSLYTRDEKMRILLHLWHYVWMGGGFCARSRNENEGKQKTINLLNSIILWILNELGMIMRKRLPLKDATWWWVIWESFIHNFFDKKSLIWCSTFIII